MSNIISSLFKRTDTVILHEKTKITNMSKIAKFPKIWRKVYYKEYPRFRRFVLPSPRISAKPGLFEAIYKRRSVREYANIPIDLRSFSTVLFFSAGINDFSEDKALGRRMYPSGGARYPLELYPVLLKPVGRLPAGIYHYHVKQHALEQLRTGDFRKEMKEIVAGVNEGISRKAPLFIIITSVFGRTEVKYGRQSYRLMLLEAGHLAQNIYLTSQAVGIGCCSIGGFVDDRINQLLDLRNESEVALYILSMGKTKRG